MTTLDPDAVWLEAVLIVHEANMRNHAGEDNLCKCGHKATSHHLAGLNNAAGCYRCEANHPGHKNYCLGYEWAQQVYLPPATEEAIRPQGEPKAIPMCGCGHMVLQHKSTDDSSACCEPGCPCENYGEYDGSNHTEEPPQVQYDQYDDWMEC